MKKIEYPIKELVRFEMDENKIWWIKYNYGHECFPERFKYFKRLSWFGNKYYEVSKQNIKEFKELLKQTTKFCSEHNFLLENGQSKMVSMFHKDLSWSKKDVLSHTTPALLFPKVILEVNYPPRCRDLYKMVGYVGKPHPYYGNPHYKKYIEDNNGECPLPLPKDVKWWEE